MKLSLLFLGLFLLQDEIPYKPSSEYNVNIDLTFKAKSSTYAPLTFTASGEALDKAPPGLLPYLVVKIKDIKFQADETRIFATNSQGKYIFKKKAANDLELLFEMGFVADLKSKVAPNEIIVAFISPEKKKVRRIVLNVSETGVFTVNGEWRGQF